MEIKVSTNQDIEIIEEDDGTRTIRIIDIPGRRLSTLRPGDTFLMDGHEWIVLDTHFKTDCGCGYGVGVISKDFYIMWTCTPWSTNNRGRNYDMVTIEPSGIISKANCKLEKCGVRPFCVLEPNTIALSIT